MADGGSGLAAAGEDGLRRQQLDEWDEEPLAQRLREMEDTKTKF